MTIHAGVGETLETVHREWVALWERDPLATVFSHPAWYLSYSAATTTGDAMVITMRNAEGALVGVCPLVRSRTGTLRFLSDPRADYGRIAIDPAADAGECVDALLDAIVRAGGGRVELREFHSEDPIPDLIAERAGAQGLWVDIRVGEPCRRLSSTVDSGALARHFVESRDTKRATARIAKRGVVRYERLVNRQELIAALPEFFALHTKRWNGVGQQIFLDRSIRDFYCKLAQMLPLEHLYFMRVRLDERTIAADFHFAYRGTLYYYKPVIDTDHRDLKPGYLLLGAIGRDMIREDFHTLDFLRGDEAYKLRFANTVGYNRSVVLFRSPLRRWRHRLGRSVVDRVRVGLGGWPKLKHRAQVVRDIVARHRFERLVGAVTRRAKAIVRPVRMVLFAASDAPREVRPPHPELSFRAGSIGDVLDVADMVNAIHKARHFGVMVERLSRGDQLVLGYWGSTLAYAGWIARRSPVRLAEIGRDIELTPGTVYVYDCHTREDLRGRGIYQAALGRELMLLSAGERAAIACRVDNLASRRAIEKAGFGIDKYLK